MLAIRMQRTGRKGYPTYRVVVQEAHRQPTSGKVVANIGSYNPHTKEVTLDKEKAEFYLKNGAQPSDRVVKLFQVEKVTLPEWVNAPATNKQKGIRTPEKLRRNQPKEESTAEEVVAQDDTSAEAPAEQVEAVPAQEKVAVSEGSETEEATDA